MSRSGRGIRRSAVRGCRRWSTASCRGCAALEETLRVQYEDPERAEARVMALAKVYKEEMKLLRAERIHEQSYQQALNALLKVREQTAAPRPPAAREVAETALIVRPRTPAPLRGSTKSEARNPKQEESTNKQIRNEFRQAGAPGPKHRGKVTWDGLRGGPDRSVWP